jgi:hypothetical protein
MKYNYKEKYKGFITAAINILSDSGIKISDDCVKVFQSDYMNTGDVLRGIQYVRNKGFNTIVYNNSVFDKEPLENRYNFRIVTGEELMKMAYENKSSMNDIIAIEKYLRRK